MSIELKHAAQQALNALDEATTYTGSPSWSPSMTDECIAAASALRAALAQQPDNASCKSVQKRLEAQQPATGEPPTETFVQKVPDHCDRVVWRGRYLHLPMTDAHPMQPIVVAENGRIRFKKNQIVDDLYELHKVHKLDLNEMACRNYSQEDRNQFAQLIGYSVGGWGTLSYAIDVEKADAIADGIIAQAKKEDA